MNEITKTLVTEILSIHSERAGEVVVPVDVLDICYGLRNGAMKATSRQTGRLHSAWMTLNSQLAATNA